MRKTTVIFCTFLSGCNLLKPVSEPKEITFEQAMTSLGTGLYNLKEAKKGVNAGLIAAEVEIVFNVNATQRSDGKIELGLTSVDPGGTSLTKTASGMLGSTASGLRSNQIRIKLVNILTLPKDSLGSGTTPEQKKKLLDVLKIETFDHKLGNRISVNPEELVPEGQQ